jgi:hypothetical protein
METKVVAAPGRGVESCQGVAVLNIRGPFIEGVAKMPADMVDDHTVYALWLGEPVALILDQMQRRGYRDALLPASQRKAA